MRDAANINIDALESYIRKNEGLPWVKLVCLEALFLANEEIDLEFCVDLLRDTKFSDYYGGRVALAAMHSKTGRTIARRGISERWNCFPVEIFFTQLRWATNEQDHSEWATLISFCNEVANDSKSTAIEITCAKNILMLNMLRSLR